MKCTKCGKNNSNKESNVFQSQKHIISGFLKWTLPYVLPPAREAGHWDDVRTKSLPPSCRWPRQTSPFGSYYRFCPLVPPCSYTWIYAVKIAKDKATSKPTGLILTSQTHSLIPLCSNISQCCVWYCLNRSESKTFLLLWNLSWCLTYKTASSPQTFSA